MIFVTRDIKQIPKNRFHPGFPRKECIVQKILTSKVLGGIPPVRNERVKSPLLQEAIPKACDRRAKTRGTSWGPIKIRSLKLR